MKPGAVVEYSVVGILLLVVVALIAGQALGRPILLSYVETGSMAPTMQPGDGFIAIPSAVAGPVVPGDVVVFDAENLHGGGLVTHRVIAHTDQGYVTMGDANPVTDQDSAEPHVQDAQIVAKALQLGGSVVVIPKIGLAVILVNDVLEAIQIQLAATFNNRQFLGTRGIAYLLFAFGSTAYVLSELRARTGERDRTRTVDRRPRSDTGALIVLALTILVVVLITASMTLPGGTHEFGVVSSSSDAPGHSVIQTGQQESFAYRIPSNGIIPTVVRLESASPGLAVTPTTLYVPGSSVRDTIVTIQAPPETGYYRFYLVEHRYLAVLPIDTIVALADIHPWLPIVAIDLLVGLGFAGIGLAILGTGRVRSYERALPVSEQLRRYFE